MAPLLIFCLLFCCFNSASLSYSFLASSLILMSLFYQLHKAKAYGFCVVGFCDLEGCSALGLLSHHRHWPPRVGCAFATLEKSHRNSHWLLTLLSRASMMCSLNMVAPCGEAWWVVVMGSCGCFLSSLLYISKFKMLLIWGKILLLRSLLPPSPLKVLKLQADCSVQLLDLDSPQHRNMYCSPVAQGTCDSQVAAALEVS